MTGFKFRRRDPQNAARRDVGLLRLMKRAAVAILPVGLIALFWALTVPNTGSFGRFTPLRLTRQTIAQTALLLDMYKLDIGRFPSMGEGLQALVTQPAAAPNWAGPYVKGKTPPRDAWGHLLLYRIPSSRSDHDYDLCSDGPSGSAHGIDAPGPICNE